MQNNIKKDSPVTPGQKNIMKENYTRIFLNNKIEAFTKKNLFWVVISHSILIGVLLLFPGENPWPFFIDTLPYIQFAARLLLILVFAAAFCWLLPVYFKRRKNSASAGKEDLLIMSLLIQEGSFLVFLLVAGTISTTTLIIYQLVCLGIDMLLYGIGYLCSRPMLIGLLLMSSKQEGSRISNKGIIVLIAVSFIIIIGVSFITVTGNLFVLAQIFCFVLFFFAAFYWYGMNYHDVLFCGDEREEKK